MLSLFPSLLTYNMFAPLFLRLILGIVLTFWGYNAIRGISKHQPNTQKDQKMVLAGILDTVVGVLLIIGLFTQAAALVAAIILAVRLVNKARSKALFTDGVNYYFILFVIAISLLFAGAGFFAFDLPL